MPGECSKDFRHGLLSVMSMRRPKGKAAGRRLHGRPPPLLNGNR